MTQQLNTMHTVDMSQTNADVVFFFLRRLLRTFYDPIIPSEYYPLILRAQADATRRELMITMFSEMKKRRPAHLNTLWCLLKELEEDGGVFKRHIKTLTDLLIRRNNEINDRSADVAFVDYCSRHYRNHSKIKTVFGIFNRNAGP